MGGLRLLQLSAPNAVVLPVVTKCDLLMPGSKDRSQAQLENAAQAQVAWLNEVLEAFVTSQPEGGDARIRVQLPVSLCLSSITGAEAAIEMLRRSRCCVR